MASQEWIEIYREYDGDALNKAIADLQKQESIFSSQGMGSKNFTRDLRELRDKLHAATRARRERNNANKPSSGSADFSCLTVN